MKIMLIMLIILPSPWLISDTDLPNNGVLYLASYLRAKGKDVAIADLTALPEEYWKIPEADVYGISTTTPQFHLAKRVAEILRQRQPNAYIIMGGPHPSALPQRTLDESEADCAVIGEGEIFLDNLPERMDRKMIVKGQFVNVDESPMPARDMIDIFQYHKIGTNQVVGANAQTEGYILTGRGCPYSCTYCAQAVISEKKTRYRQIDSVKAEVEYLVKRYAVQRIYFYDDTFILDKKRVWRFCEAIKPLHRAYGFDWHCLSRSNICEYELYKEMYESGCRQITYGVESGSDEILKLAKKGTTSDKNKSAIAMAHKSGLRVRAQMMVGLPGETDATVEATAEFMRTSDADSWGVHIFVPLPGSEIYHHPERFGFEFNMDAPFQHFRTIGRPNERSAAHIHKNSEQIIKWHALLQAAAGERNVHKLMK